MMEESQRNNWLVTGLIYIDTDNPTLPDLHNLPETPLNRLTEKDLRPARETLDQINATML